MDDLIPSSVWRMDWGLGNPNKTAALIALLMIAVWILGYIRRWGFWAALSLFAGLGICLILTQSRGALVGVIVGGVLLLAWAPRPFPWERALSTIGVCIVLAAFSFVVNAGPRYIQGISSTDRSIDNRLLIWKQVPAMIHDAPNGWGMSKSGNAYMQWYQPINRGEGYRTLVNSHFTWLTELNWFGRVGYVLAWITVLTLSWPQCHIRWFSIPFATCVVLIVCACFSSVAEVPVLWLVPLLAIVGVIVARHRKKCWPSVCSWIWCGVGSIVVIASIVVSGIVLDKTNKTPKIYCPRVGTVIIGPRVPKIWIVAPNPSILGEHFGHEARRGFERDAIYDQMGLGIVALNQDAPLNQTLVFSGQFPAEVKAMHPSQIILINPKPTSTDMLQILEKQGATVIVGEFSRSKDYWIKQARQHSNIKVQLVLGSEEYIPGWMHEIAESIKQ